MLMRPIASEKTDGRRQNPEQDYFPHQTKQFKLKLKKKKKSKHKYTLDLRDGIVQTFLLPLCVSNFCGLQPARYDF